MLNIQLNQGPLEYRRNRGMHNNNHSHTGCLKLYSIKQPIVLIVLRLQVQVCPRELNEQGLDILLQVLVYSNPLLIKIDTKQVKQFLILLHIILCHQYCRRIPWALNKQFCKHIKSISINTSISPQKPYCHYKYAHTNTGTRIPVCTCSYLTTHNIHPTEIIGNILVRVLVCPMRNITPTTLILYARKNNSQADFYHLQLEGCRPLLYLWHIKQGLEVVT